MNLRKKANYQEKMRENIGIKYEMWYNFHKINRKVVILWNSKNMMIQKNL